MELLSLPYVSTQLLVDLSVEFLVFYGRNSSKSTGVWLVHAVLMCQLRSYFFAIIFQLQIINGSLAGMVKSTAIFIHPFFTKFFIIDSGSHLFWLQCHVLLEVTAEYKSVII